jgi:hypothetical protein
MPPKNKNQEVVEEEEEEDEIITDEEFNSAVLIFAHYLGIDLENESELIYIASDALNKLPKGWKLGLFPSI